ncbi:invasin [Kosakonia cowanii]|nr:invasin [Kosakonia cowanii]
MKCTYRDCIPLRVRLLTWLNIAVQAAFPLAVAFTPVMAVAVERNFLQSPAQLSSLRTQVYALSADETTASVARKYHLTPEQLRKLNQFRTFAHDFDNLQPGEELDVPLTPLPEVKWDNPPASLPAAADGGDDAQSRKIASVVSRTGTFLANRPDGKAAASMARGMATGGAGSAIQQWLSRFGTARVQLDMDDRFSLRNSQLDLLVPLYERKDRLVFTQGSLHRSDDRSQANLGAGFRHFYDRWMFGLNSFADYDLSRDHARAGVGLEYWRDFLKLGFNGYVHLTGWKDSPDLEDYEARPANGWDVRAQAWLPSLPQLGGKLTYEQYYGKEVALSGVNDRRKNPRALTAGINYTPFPLLTLSAEQRQAQGGKSDTRLGINLSYRPGVPWQQQINPDAVGAMRSLAGSRYDLVERNNNIVLEYRRKEVIRLRTAPRVTGYQGEQKSLGVSVTSRHGLARIDWEASALLAAGGSIVRNGGDWMVVLPAYRPAAVNTYTVSGVAVDTRGNRSDRSVTQVTVRAPAVNRDNSTFTPVKSTLPADGRSTQVLTLTLRDDNNRAADMDVKDISLNSSVLKSATISALTRKSAGVYTVTVTAGTDAETVTLTPSVSGITLSPAEVTISSTTPDAGQSVFTAGPETIAADNTATSTLTLVVKDAQGNPLTGLKDSLKFAVKDSGGKVPAAGVITESAIAESSTKGTYTATLKGTAAGRYTVVPEYNGTAMGSLSAAVTLTATAPSRATSGITTDRDAYVSGTDMQVKVTLKDAQGNAVTGASSSLTTETVTVQHAAVKAGGGWKDNGDGTYTATYTATTAGTGLRAAVRLSGWSAAKQSEKYAITATAPDRAKSGIATDKTSYTSGEDMTVKVTLKDAQGNAVTGASSSLTTETVTVQHAAVKAGGGWKDNGDGTYTATYTATTAGTGLRAAVRLSGWSAAKQSEKYAITATAPDRAKSGIATDKTSYTSGEDMTVKVTLKDAQGNAVTGASSSLTTETVTVQHAALKAGGGWKDDGDGTYTATYTAITAGTNLKAAVRLNGWDAAAQSGTYAITLGDEAPDSINTQVNPYTFSVASEDGTFPSTGFAGATFTIVPKNNAKASGYTWTADAPWVSVTDGVVRFTGKGTGNKVTVTGTPVSGQGNIIRYSFALKSWFINSSSQMNWSDADAYCSRSGRSLPTVQQLNGSTSHSDGTRGIIGALWSEWGNLSSYSGAGFDDLYSFAWSSEWGENKREGRGNYYYINWVFGNIVNHNATSLNYVVCRQRL